jgi:serine/threonine-protein kinase
MDEVAFGRYRLIALIGEGGMGKVYRAHDTVMGRDVAVKVLPAELATEPGYEQRFRREASVAARLSEPHIIPIFEAGEIEGRLYLVMPIIDGIDVHSLLQRDGPMSPQRAVGVIEQLAAALNAAHQHGLVHRDIKPSNALLTGDDFVYLIDFGIAHDAAATRLTSTGMMVGTLAYMAPERFTAGVADARSDVYALACVLFECLTGATPFLGDNLEQQIAGHLTVDPPKPSEHRADLPAGLDEVVATGMAKKPDERYQSARELAVAARRALSEGPTPAREVRTATTRRDDTVLPPPRLEDRLPPPSRASESLRRPGVEPVAPAPLSGQRQGRVALIAAIIVVILVGAGITAYRLRAHSSATQTPTAQPALPSESTAQPALPSESTAQPPPSSQVLPSATAPSEGIQGLAPFVGIWQAHTQRVVIDTAGNGHLTYRGCIACATQTDNTVDFTLTSVSNGIASGSVITTSDAYYTGKPVTAMVAAGSPGQMLQLTLGAQQLAFCNSVAEAAGECGA